MGEEWNGQEVRVSIPAATQPGTVTSCICEMMVILVTTGHSESCTVNIISDPQRNEDTISEVGPINHMTITLRAGGE